jgi:hypothetical protein
MATHRRNNFRSDLLGANNTLLYFLEHCCSGCFSGHRRNAEIHPRDLFDVMRLFAHEEITPRIRRAFVVYLASHNRPVHEVGCAMMANQLWDGCARLEQVSGCCWSWRRRVRALASSGLKARTRWRASMAAGALPEMHSPRARL